ncbi:MAG TPA: cupin domain-containing protein [Polyangiaceae bacterium]|nr:cupin domain-containing protein [Polyangiaceae bacterium]
MKRHDDAVVAAVKADLEKLAAEEAQRTAPDPFVGELEDGDREVVAEIASLLEPVDPPTSLRERLLSSTMQGRLARFAAPVAKLLDVDDARAEALLDGIDDPASWSPSPVPGMVLYHFEGGEKVADCITGFTRIARGGAFPEHEHLGTEYVLVVQGRVRDGVSGEIYGPGDLSIMEAGTSHDLEVLPGPALVYLVVIFDGIRLGGVEFRPGDPRI